MLADDSVLFREGVARVLADNGFVVAGQAGDAGELHALVEREAPDVVVTAIRMPPTTTGESSRSSRISGTPDQRRSGCAFPSRWRRARRKVVSPLARAMAGAAGLAGGWGSPDGEADNPCAAVLAQTGPGSTPDSTRRAVLTARRTRESPSYSGSNSATIVRSDTKPSHGSWRPGSIRDAGQTVRGSAATVTAGALAGQSQGPHELRWPEKTTAADGSHTAVFPGVSISHPASPARRCRPIPASPGNLINAVPGRAHVDGYSTSPKFPQAHKAHHVCPGHRASVARIT